LLSLRSILPVLLLALFAACGTTPEQKPKPPSMDEMLAQMTEQSGSACIRFKDIENHEALEDDLISVSTRGKEHYLVTTTSPCNLLRRSSGILVSDSWGTLCSGGGAAISEGGLGGLDRSCPVRNVYSFPSRKAAMAALLVAKSRREVMEQFPDVEP
jgi:hypothetical protein